jgi:lipid-binding SYLF domain-containing protein
MSYPATVIGRAPPQASKSKHPKHCQAGPDKQSQAYKAEQEAFRRLISRTAALSIVEWQKHVGRLIGGVELG